MDVRLRQLERSYKQGMLGKEEIHKLRGFYINSFSFCPSWFVIQQIKDSVQDYLTSLYIHHRDTRDYVEQLLAPYNATGDPTVAQVLEKERPFLLSVSSQVEEKEVNGLPMIIAQVWLRIPHIDPAYGKWREMRDSARNYLLNMFASHLEQCGYLACVTPQQHDPIIGDILPLTGIGYPISQIASSPINDEFRELYRTWPQSRGSSEKVRVIMSVPIDTLQLTGRKTHNTDSVVIPGALRHWLLEGNPDGTGRGSVYGGQLLLATVPDEFFLAWSASHRLANRTLTQAFEADIEEYPEMIFFINTYYEEIFLVPTPTEYFKRCYYLQLVADV